MNYRWLVYLSLMFVSGVASASDMSHCLSVIEQKGVRCDRSPNSLGLIVENTCKEAVVAKSCFKTPEGVDCQKELIAPHDEGFTLHVCHSSGKYDLSACLRGATCGLEPNGSVDCPVDRKIGRLKEEKIPVKIEIIANGVYKAKKLKQDGDGYKLVSSGNITVPKHKRDKELGEDQLIAYFCGEMPPGTVVGTITIKLREKLHELIKAAYQECLVTEKEYICKAKYYPKRKAPGIGTRNGGGCC